MLFGVYKPLISQPQDIVREVYRDFWGDLFPLSISEDRAVVFLWRGVRGLIRLRISDPQDRDVARWLWTLGFVRYHRTLARFRDSRVWNPRGLLAVDVSDDGVLAPYEGREVLLAKFIFSWFFEFLKSSFLYSFLYGSRCCPSGGHNTEV